MEVGVESYCSANRITSRPANVESSGRLRELAYLVKYPPCNYNYC